MIGSQLALSKEVSNGLLKEVSNGRETVLLVDDDPLVLDIGWRILRRLGYRVLLATDGQEAVKVYREHSDEVALVILDVMMPKMNGREALGHLKRLNGGVKVLVVTGSYTEEVEAVMLAEGAEAILKKPYRVEELGGAVRQMLDRALA
jgi:CheY-like chemotaxis protein